jgi:hypothetical protein
VRGMICRGPRLELVAGLVIALAMPALAMAVESARALATQTTLTAETRDQAGRTQAIVAVTVTGEDGLPATGAVAVSDHGRQLAGAALNAEGQARMVLALPAGGHSLRAVYTGDATHSGSVSQTSDVQAQATATPDFQVTVAPLAPATFPLTLTAGTAGTVVVTLTPENNSALTAPMFVTLSCSGLPDQASCTPTPENLEILSTTPTSCAAGSPASSCPPTSSMVIQTQKASSTSSANRQGKGSGPIAWAILLPGVLGLGGLAWGARRRLWLSRFTLLALVGLVLTLGATACSPRYDYFNHNPPVNPATPAGTYTVTVTGQSSNGVTATNRFTTFVLTVQ